MRSKHKEHTGNTKGETLLIPPSTYSRILVTIWYMPERDEKIATLDDIRRCAHANDANVGQIFVSKYSRLIQGRFGNFEVGGGCRDFHGSEYHKFLCILNKGVLAVR